MKDISALLDRPIAFQRVFVRLGVGITGALMLSQAVYWSRRTDDGDGWFYKTAEEWEEETGLTRREQETARAALRTAGILYEVKKGVPCKLFYRIDYEALQDQIGAIQECANPPIQYGAKRQTRMAESAMQDVTNPPNIIGTETTTEITTETTADMFRDAPKPRTRSAAKKPNAASSEVWNAYAGAYLQRYGTEPVRNAAVNGQITRIISAIGAEEAKHVAVFYVSHNNRYYIQQCHSVAAMLKDITALRTQWATNMQVTASKARSLDRMGDTGSRVGQVVFDNTKEWGS